MGRYSWISLLGLPALAIALVLICFGIFTQMGWLPVVAPLLGILIASSTVIAYRLASSTRYNHQRMQ
jgi:CHASE2 domain-containing sensor protein